MQRRPVKKFIAFLLPAALAAALLCGAAVPSAADGAAGENAAKSAAPAVAYTGTVENDRYSLACDKESGNIRLTDKATGRTYEGVPEGGEEDPVAKGPFKMVLNSQLVIRGINILTNQLADITTYASCVKKNTVTVEQLADGFRVIYRFETEKLTVPVYFRLDGGSFRVSVPAAEITEGEKYWIKDLEILPYFAAGGTEDEGFILIPDGSGAVISFNNGKGASGDYTGKLYGRDDSFYLKKKTTVTEDVRLPVFGMERNGYGFLATASGADAAGKLMAGVAGTKTSYNYACFGFTLHSTDTVYINKDTWYEKGVLRVNEEQEFEELRVDYRFYEEENGGYFRMAELYRESLAASGGREAVQSPSLLVSVLSAIDVDKSVLGIPMNLIRPLSTFEETGKLLDALGETETTAVRLLNATKQAVKAGKKSGYSPLGSLGGKKGLEALLSREGTRFFADADIPFFSAGTFHLSAMLGGAKSLSRETALRYTYDMADYSIDKEARSLGLLRPGEFTSAAGKVTDAALARGFDGVSPGSLGASLYSNFDSKHTVYRQAALEEVVQAYRDALGKGQILTAAPTAYVLPFSDLLADIPTSSSGYELFDGDVPFFALVLSGYKPFAFSSSNLEADRRAARLRVLETGAVPQYTLFYRDAGEVKDTRYAAYYSCCYTDWAEDAAAIRQEAAAFAAGTGAVTRHRMLARNLFEVAYESGAVYLFNYGTQAADAQGVTVEAMSCRLVKGG